MVPPKPDLRGIDHIFTFSAMPGPVTCFEGVQLLPPAHYLQITPGNEGGAEPVISERAYWEMDFPTKATRTRKPIRASWWMNSSSCC